MWRQGLQAKFLPSELSPPIKPFGRQEFDQLLGNYRALCDFPANMFAEDLIAAYLEAKVVLVERDIEAWYKSFDKAVIQPCFDPVTAFIAKLDRQYLARLNLLTMAWIRGFFRSTTKKELEENARVVYREHYALIRKVTPKDRLLEFKFKDGWEPLCRFLGKEVPDVEFPHINDSKAMEEKIGIVLKAAALRLLKNVALVGGSVWVVILGVYWCRNW